MPALILPLLGSSASMACGFAAIGLAVYAPLDGASGAALYGAFGAVAGLVCAVIDAAWRQLPTTVLQDVDAHAHAHAHAPAPGAAAAGHAAQPGALAGGGRAGR